MSRSIHENIRDLRKEKKLTQEQLAEALGVSGASVSKWENGLCAPDLSLISAMADYFEVSVDALLGHELQTERLNEMLKELQALAEAGSSAEMEALAERILRHYPNSFEAVEGCANAYSSLYVMVEDGRTYIEKSIELTKRLFVLGRGESETDRLERITRMGNQYELLGDWEKAEKYYREGNVNGVNNRHMAVCLMRQGRYDKAIEAFSDELLGSVFRQFQQTVTFAELWKEIGEDAKACRLYEWMAESMERVGLDARLRQLLCIQLADVYERLGRMEEAKRAVCRIIRLADEPDGPADFLKPGKPQKLLSNLPASPRETMEMLLPMVNEELRRAAEEEMKN